MRASLHTRRTLPVRPALLAFTLIAAAVVVRPAIAEDTPYRMPSATLTAIIDAPQTPAASLSPDFSTMLLLEQPNLPSIEELAERELRLAGRRIKPQVNGPSRSRPYSGIAVLKLSDQSQTPVRGIPEGARIENVRWSPDGSRILFTNTTTDGIELWMADVNRAEAKRITGPVLNMTMGVAPAWLPDNATILCTMLDENRGSEPEASRVPAGPIVQENLEGSNPARTYQDLLTDAHDEALFDYYFTSRLVKVTLDGKATTLVEPAVIGDFDPSPDGNYVRVETLHRPYSYLVPYYRFPHTVEVIDLAGQVVRRMADLPLQEGVPVAFGSVPTGPRSFGWRADAPATLVWVEARDGGDAGAEAEIRDELFVMAAPFAGEPTPWMTLALRYGGVTWGRDDLALVSSWWWKTRTQRTWTADPSDPGASAELLFEHNWEDRYNDPGSPETRLNEFGQRVLYFSEDGGSMFLIGEGASSDGDRPFFDRMDLASHETTRLFRSEAPYFERPIQLADPTGRFLITRRETAEEPPNYFMRDLQTGDLTQITRFPHPTPQLVGIQKEMIQYPREDGVTLNGTLYLPAGYSAEKDGPLPVLMWAYPQEFKSADAAGQVQGSPYQFSRVGWWSPLLFLTQGYAVLDDPSMPIIGEGDEEPNDTYVEQLVASARGAVDELVRRGVGDPARMAIGGHSYGAFMTANLLAHSDLFAAGLARSGAYNRTLTPFGFQSEERTVWEAPEVYAAMSPFMHADKVNEPLLLVHGQADNNSGTFPMQSERFYGALKGLGATVRLVMLPHESHGYRARESVLHMLWESETWLDRYVKHAGEAPAGGSSMGTPGR